MSIFAILNLPVLENAVSATEGDRLGSRPQLDAPELTAEEGEKPNVILIMVDDMGFSDIGCYGGPVKKS